MVAPKLKAILRYLGSLAKDFYCSAVSDLAENERIRFGADGAGGLGGALVAGYGLSVRRDGSVEGDIYGGLGIGLGALAGGGFSDDTAGSLDNSPRNRTIMTGGQELTGGIGFADGGFGITVPIAHGPDGYPHLKTGSSTGGVSNSKLGPNLGLFAGAILAKGTWTKRTPAVCP